MCDILICDEVIILSFVTILMFYRYVNRPTVEYIKYLYMIEFR